ncbi:NAD(P)H-dependent oxidoreductase, partial [Streptomyces sp. NPDC051162]|uniref:flavodoxin family protein n=1 Tax=Streptomyces sp. NPDC051162 TaxID=3154747 RepID=UPI00343EFA24
AGIVAAVEIDVAPTVVEAAHECAAGARELGAEVRLRGPEEPAAADDVAWADAVAFGAPVRSGSMAASMLGFLQSLEPPAGPGPLSGKPASGFVATAHPQAGSESALLSLHHVLHHSGALVVPPGYTDPAVFAAGGNPYGTSHARSAGALPGPEVLAAARHQGRRLALAGARLSRRAVPAGAVIPDDILEEKVS